MELPPIISDYFTAWNHHDASAIVACLTAEGLYCDPYVPSGVNGAYLVQYTQRVFEGMPDIRFDIQAVYISDSAVIVEWLMVASPHITVPGVDIFTIEGDQISKVQGYYDRKLFEGQQ
jgi:hypothetical protein